MKATAEAKSGKDVQRTMNRLRATRIGSAVATAGTRLLDVLLPVNCVVCRTEGQYLCEGCVDDLPRLTSPYCYLCANPNVPQLCRWCFENSPRFDRARAPYLYEGPAKQMVLDLKYRGVRIAARPMARMLAGYLERNPYPVDALVPVPLHTKRERQRGYSQSGLLCEELSDITGVPVNNNALRRTRNTSPQVEMDSPEDRRSNISRAFECTSELEGARIMLMDDVITTGNTMSACAEEMKVAGVASVWGLAFARQGA